MMNLFLDTNSASNGIIGGKTGVFTTTAINTQSTINAIDNLQAKVVYANGLSNMPIMLLIHGWGDNYKIFTQATYERFANYGYCVLGIGLRMELGTKGLYDITAREIFDIIDVLRKAQNQLGALVNKNKTIAVGYSFGGGVTLALGSKCPDMFTTLVNHFGMSDFGYSSSSWYLTNPIALYTTPMDTYIGAPRTSKLNEYLSREYRNSFGKNFKGRLYIFHDESDTAVSVVHSDNLVSNLISDSYNNYYYSRSKSGDTVRWTHAYPNDTASVIQSELIWANDGLINNKVSRPLAGNVLVRGFIVTDYFQIWLGDGVDSLKDGTNRSAFVNYDIFNSKYTLIPFFENGVTSMYVRILQKDGKSASQTITTETEIIVS